MEEEEKSVIDNMLVQLMNMGFELDDCQQALVVGNFCLQDAMEWLLQGKPQVVTDAGPTLVLRKNNTGSQFDSGGLGSKKEEMSVDDASPDKENPVKATPVQYVKSEVQITSRLAKNEASRTRFEEKQRKEAEDIARKARLDKKLHHESVMKRIAQDKEEKRKMEVSKQPATDAPSCTKSEENQAAVGSSVAKQERPEILLCNIQVRCPKDRIIKKSFTPKQPLSALWEHLEHENIICTDMILFQPFPRYHFTDDDKLRSFEELGLVPSGSLVLKSQESDITGANLDFKPSTAISKGIKSHPSNHYRYPGPARHPNRDSVDTINHRSPAAPRAAAAVAARQNNLNRRQRDDANFQEMVADLNRNVEDLYMDDDPDFMHTWGDGQRLGGEHPRNAHELPRFLLEQPQCVLDENASSSYEPLCAAVPTLNDLCIQWVIRQILEPRTRSHMNLPACVAESIVQYMAKDEVLRPQHLQYFISCHLKKLTFDCFRFATNELLYALRQHTYLQHLSLASCSLITDKGLENLTYLKRLTLLNLRGCAQITDNCFSVIQELSLLSVLILEETKVSDSGINEFLSEPKPNLRVLNLNRTRIDGRCFPSLQNASNLRCLSLDGTKIESLHLIPPLPNLEGLSMQMTTVSDMELLRLAKFPRLVHLTIGEMMNINGDLALQLISGAQLKNLQLPSRLTTTDQGLAHLVNMPLTSLNLTNYIHIGDEGVAAIGCILSLKQLHLSNTKITDEGLQSLKDLSKLEVMYLDRTAVTDNGILVLKNMPKLEELSLASTRIKGCHLVEILNCCVKIAKLNLSRTRIINKVLKGFAAPNLTLLNVDGTRLCGDLSSLFAGCPRLKHVSARLLQPPPSLLHEDSDSD